MANTPQQPQAVSYVSYDGNGEAPPGMNQTPAFFLANYRLGKTLGNGSFGKVKIAEHVLTQHKVAIKILNKRKIKQQDMEEKVRREIKILRLFMHPHIIRLYEVIETDSDIYVVMEFVKAGELFDYIVEKGRLVEDDARRFFQQIISGVEYCHRNMVVHRDLKPENLLLDSKMNIKIADFGLSNVMRDGHFLKTSCGSPNYAAPEVISGKLYSGPEVDVWSCGVILYALLCGSLPFDDENIPNLFRKIKGGIYNLPTHLSHGARDLIPRMLVVDPLKRITIPEIRQHPWFTLHLPRYLAVMQADTLASSATIDDEIVAEVVKLGFRRADVVDSIQKRVQNKATVAYYLMSDNRRRMPSDAYLRAELTEAHDPRHAFPSGMMTPAAGPAGHGGPPGAGQARVVAERRWRLGVPSRSHPHRVIEDLLRSLAAHAVAYKKQAPYNYKCRKVFPALAEVRLDALARESSGAEAGGHHHQQQQQQQQLGADGNHHTASLPGSRERLLKFEIQLYKMRDGEYCLDIQRLAGEMFLFMDLCGSLISRQPF